MTLPQVAPLGATDLILCDFDGTISTVDTGVAVIEALDLAEAWEVEYQWRRGEISSMECMRRQWGMVNLTPEQMYELVDGLTLDPDFPRFVELVRERQAALVVLSDGLDFYIDRLLAAIGLQTIPGHQSPQADHEIRLFANHARVTPDGIEIEFPYRAECAQCGNCKTAHLFRLRRGYARTLYLGDGHSDLCAARFADLVFARDALAEDCRQSGRPYVPFTSFAEVLALLT
jgi:2,3-diketo-5-methylthio-1-phosphopentane phosphatase